MILRFCGYQSGEKKMGEVAQTVNVLPSQICGNQDDEEKQCEANITDDVSEAGPWRGCRFGWADAFRGNRLLYGGRSLREFVGTHPLYPRRIMLHAQETSVL